jgi:hypothetical protein
MNTRTYGIGKTAEQADSVDSRSDQVSFFVDLGTVTNETRHIAPPVTMDSQFTVGTLGG